jgi:two-component system, NarL family, sensor histidine kinase DesK
MSFASPDACDRSDAGPAGRNLHRVLAGGQLFGQSPGGVRSAIILVWAVFVVFPLINAVGTHGSTLRQVLVFAGAAVFVASYVILVLTWRLNRPTRLTAVLFVVLLGVASALTLDRPSAWAFLFTYCSACTFLVARERVGLQAVALCTGLAAVTSTIGGGDGGTVISSVASCAGIGLLMLVMGDLRLRNQQLSEARAELAQMAVSRERERFARDLHDLLGHSLSVITLKAELAGRMLTDRPDDAAREVAELEQVARTALGEVRDAVSGYHQPTLEGELAGARMALSAAGIEAEVQEARVALDPAVEAVLAWAVREGATNVIRHSHARHCTLSVSASLTDAGVEVTDDGVGVATDILAEATAGNGVGNRPPTAGRPVYAVGAKDGLGLASRAGGHGLAGLADRAGLVNGTIEAGALAGGGYRLAVTVPVPTA